ncbi:PHP domain-containing protein [Desulfococcaceae bacterium HSG8]|nr:PHP domain-containing protein [Desulfococcaceae bacterium HSG8]
MQLPKMKWSRDERADLHLHSDRSDGLCSPAELAGIAARKGLRVIALTDHACVTGIPDITFAAANYGIYVIPGVELNSEKGDFLGYFIDYQDRQLLSFLEDMNHSRAHRMKKIVRRLNSLGITAGWSSLVRFSHPAVPSRTHLARMLVSKGDYPDVESVFRNLLGPGKPAYVSSEAPSEEECIRMIRDAGGVSVIAHPHFLGDISEEETEAYCALLAERGVAGYEDIPVSAGRPSLKAAWNRAGEKHGLLRLGGSDFHGNGISGGSLGDVTAGGDRVQEMIRRLPEKCLHRNLFKRMLWRSENLTAEEFRESLFPKELFLDDLSCRHLLKFRPSVPDLPPDFRGMPFILLGPSAVRRHSEVKQVMETLNLQVISEETRGNYPEIAWTIYDLDELDPDRKIGELYRFTLDHYLYGKSASQARIIYFRNNSGLSLWDIKRKLRSAMGQMKFYRVTCGTRTESNFTSFIHVPDEKDIDMECWKLHQIKGF